MMRDKAVYLVICGLLMGCGKKGANEKPPKPAKPSMTADSPRRVSVREAARPGVRSRPRATTPTRPVEIVKWAKRPPELGVGGGVVGVAREWTGWLVTVGHDGNINLWLKKDSPWRPWRVLPRLTRSASHRYAVKVSVLDVRDKLLIANRYGATDLYSMQSGKRLHSFPGGAAAVVGTHEFLAVAGTEGLAVYTHKPKVHKLASVPVCKPSTMAAISTSERVVVGCESGHLEVYHLKFFPGVNLSFQKLEQLKKLRIVRVRRFKGPGKGPIRAIYRHPLDNETKLLLAQGNTVYLVHLKTGKVLRQVDGHKGPVRALSDFAPGTMVSGSQDGTVAVMSVNPLKRKRSSDMGCPRVAALANGQSVGDPLAVGCLLPGQLQLRSQPGLKLLQRWVTHSLPVRLFSLAPDGSRIAAAVRGGQLRVWSVPDGKAVAKRSVPGAAVAAGPRGAGVAWATLCALHMQRDGGKPVRLWPSTAASPDCAKGLTAWGNKPHQGYRIMPRHRPRIRFSADGKYLVAAYPKVPRRFARGAKAAGPQLRVWEVASGKSLGELPDVPGPLQALAVSPKAPLVAGVGAKGGVVVWSLATRTLVKRLDVKRAGAVSFSGDGAWLAVAAGGQTVLFDTKTWSAGKKLYTGKATHLTLSHDGKQLAVSTKWGTKVRFYDVAAGKRTRELKAHHLRITGLAGSPDGSHLVSASEDGAIRFWPWTAKK